MPKFEDCCNHGKDSFIGTIHVVEKLPGSRKWSTTPYDIYLFPDRGFGVNVCMRYGNEPSEYISTTLEHLISAQELSLSYKQAWQLVKAKGKLSWIRDPDAPNAIGCDFCLNNGSPKCEICEGEYYE